MIRSLADIAIGDAVQVRSVCFDLIRAHCATVGIRAGAIVRQVGGEGPDLVLETRHGARIGLDRFYACFVETVPTDGAQVPVA